MNKSLATVFFVLCCAECYSDQYNIQSTYNRAMAHMERPPFATHTFVSNFHDINYIDSIISVTYYFLLSHAAFGSWDPLSRYQAPIFKIPRQPWGRVSSRVWPGHVMDFWLMSWWWPGSRESWQHSYGNAFGSTITGRRLNFGPSLHYSQHLWWVGRILVDELLVTWIKRELTTQLR